MGEYLYIYKFLLRNNIFILNMLHINERINIYLNKIILK